MSNKKKALTRFWWDRAQYTITLYCGSKIVRWYSGIRSREKVRKIVERWEKFGIMDNNNV